MVNWELRKNISVKEWNDHLVCFSNYDYFQSYNWGEYKKSFGWTPYRFIAVNSKNNVIAMAQCLFKSFPFSIGILWCPGGPVGDYKTINNNFRELCYKIMEKKLLYIRVRLKNLQSIELRNYLIENKWELPKHKITNNLSMILDLTPNEEYLKSMISKNWKRNLNRFKENKLVVKKCINIKVDEMISIYRDMENYKKISTIYSETELLKIIEHFKDKIVLYRCHNMDGKTVAFRGAIILDNNAFDFFSATHSSARKLYPSNKLFWTLLLECKRMGVSNYDLSGIDPINNPGVYNFKKGTGATEIESVGELEWSNSSIIKYLFNLALKIKVI